MREIAVIVLVVGALALSGIVLLVGWVVIVGGILNDWREDRERKDDR